MSSLWNLFLNWFYDLEPAWRYERRKLARKYAREQGIALTRRQAAAIQRFLREERGDDE